MNGRLSSSYMGNLMHSNALNSVSRKILLIDDRRDAILPIRLLLSRDGHKVFEASTGEEGVTVAVDVQPDLILCDIGLPGQWDGYAVVRELRTKPQTKATYMVAVSGYCQPIDIERSQQAGFDDHFAKPVDIARLRRLVAEDSLKSTFLLHDILSANAAGHQADDKQNDK